MIEINKDYWVIVNGILGAGIAYLVYKHNKKKDAKQSESAFIVTLQNELKRKDEEIGKKDKRISDLEAEKITDQKMIDDLEERLETLSKEFNLQMSRLQSDLSRVRTQLQLTNKTT